MSDHEENLCHCGSLTDAIRVAEKLFVETHAMNCPVWTMQVAVAFRTICLKSIIVETGIPVGDVKLLAHKIAAITMATMATPEELLRRSEERADG